MGIRLIPSPSLVHRAPWPAYCYLNVVWVPYGAGSLLVQTIPYILCNIRRFLQRGKSYKYAPATTTTEAPTAISLSASA